MPHPLDNPIFESLANRHRPLALQQGKVLRYPPDIAPFLGVPRHLPQRPVATTLIAARATATTSALVEAAGATPETGL